MAASKIHLANTDKNYKLKKTDKVTTEGKPIYVNTLTGDEHSEISVTIEYPANSGKWINVPSLLNGRVYNSKGVLAMLKAGKLTPTSTHMSEQEAVEAAVYRSTTLQSNTGETLKPNNEINLVTSQSARINEQEAPGLIAEVNRAENAFQNQETGFPAQIQAADDYNPEKEAFINQNMNTFASTFPTRDENSDGLFVVDRNINLEESLNDQILGTDKVSMEETAAKSANERASLERMYQIMDRAQSEKDDSYFYNPDNPDLNTPWKNWNAKYRMGDILRGTGLKGAENPTMNRYTQTPVSAADQAMFDNAKEERRLLHMGKAMSSYGPRYTPPMDTGTRTKKELLPPMPLGNAPAMDDTADIEAGMKTKYTFSEGPSTRGRKRKKPIFSFNMSPDEKMKDNRNLKGLTPDYGEMPGFKKAKDGNYWSADENSEFWKTDAGYQKAVETWGASGNPLPAYVKKPARKELDVQAIKNFFKPNR